LTNADGGLVTVGTAGEGLFVVGYLAGSTETLKICVAEGDTAMSAGHLSAVGLLFEIGTGALVFNHTDADYKFGTPIYGAGAVDVLAGVSTLSATNYYTGDTMATGGSLLLSGSLRGDSYVSGSGILGGTGVARNIYVHSGGTLAR
jgi:hypothetical protein